MTATVTPLREKQLVQIGDRMLGTLHALLNGFVESVGDDRITADITLGVEELHREWMTVAHGAQAEDGEAA